MLKTEEQIECDFYLFIKESVLGQNIQGKVYRFDMRPENANTEDIVVKFLGGQDKQLQTGVVIANIYVPDLVGKDGRRVRNMARFKVLSALVYQFLWDFKCDDGYSIETDGTPKVLKHEEINQNCLNVRLRFSRMAN